MKKPLEIVPGDKSVRLNFYLFLAIYILIIISAESLIDFVLPLGVDVRNPESIILMNQNKVVITNVVITAMYILPMMMIAWLGYRVLTSAKLPPARMKLPFAVPLVKGKKARLVGIILMSISFYVLSHAIVVMLQKIVL